MHRLHILDKVIINEYLKRNKNDDWHDEECRDDEEFLKVKEELWSTMYPGQASALTAQDKISTKLISDSAKLTLDVADEGDNLCIFSWR